LQFMLFRQKQQTGRFPFGLSLDKGPSFAFSLVRNYAYTIRVSLCIYEPKGWACVLIYFRQKLQSGRVPLMNYLQINVPHTIYILLSETIHKREVSPL
jgi:hypothetical protein